MDDMHKEEISLCMQEIGCDPEVLGYRLLIKVPEVPDKINGVYLPNDYKDTQARRQNMGRVLKIGPEAFVEKNQFNKCKVGDWIHYSILEREPIYPNGHTCYYINDDKLYAIVPPHEVEMYLDSRK